MKVFSIQARQCKQTGSNVSRFEGIWGVWVWDLREGAYKMLGITRLRLLRVGRGNGADFSAPAALETIEAEQPKPPLHTHREGARRHGLLHVQLGQTLQLHLMASQASTSLGRFYTPHAQQVFAGREEPQSHSKEAETTPARLS